MDPQRIFMALKDYAIQGNVHNGTRVYPGTQIAALGYWENGGLQTEDFHIYDRRTREHSEQHFLRKFILPYKNDGVDCKWFIYTRKMPCGPGLRTGIGATPNTGGHDCMMQLIGATTGLVHTRCEIWVGFETPYAGWPGQNVRGQGATHANMERSWYDGLYARNARGLSPHKTRFWDMNAQCWVAMRGMDIEINPVTLAPQADGTIEPQYVIDPDHYAG